MIERESNIPPCRSSSANLALVAVATRARFAELELRVIIDSTNESDTLITFTTKITTVTTTTVSTKINKWKLNELIMHG